MSRKALAPNKNGGARKNAGRNPIPAHERRRTIGISMAPDELAALDAFAEREGMSRSYAAVILMRVGMLATPARRADEKNGGDDHGDE